jgi:hypothetical protein
LKDDCRVLQFQNIPYPSNNHTIFCEGELEHLAFGQNFASGKVSGHNMASGPANGQNFASGVASGQNMASGPAFGHNSASGAASGQNLVFGLIMAFGRNKLITAGGHKELIMLTNVGPPNKLIGKYSEIWCSI